MKWKASVVRLTGRTRHNLATIDGDGIHVVRPLGDPTWVEIQRADQGMYFLIRYAENGAYCGDTWHPIEGAKKTAEAEYEIDSSTWTEVAD